MKVLNPSIYTLLLLILLVSSQSFAQENSDLESWNAINLKYELNKKWEIELEGQLRLKEDISEVDKYFGEFATTYNLTKQFALTGAFRYIRENDNVGKKQGYENHIRYHFDASYKHKIHDFSLKYRFRYQNKNELGVDDFANQHYRFKAGVGYNIKNWKLDPKFSAEIFYHDEKEEENGFDKYRLTLGSSYKFKKSGEIDFYYRFQRKMDDLNPESTHIIGLKYSVKFKN